MTNQYHCGTISKVIDGAPAPRGGLGGWTEGNMDSGKIGQAGAVRKRATNKAVKFFRINEAQKTKPMSPIESARRA